MSFTEAIKTCFRKYIDFSGRASRPEYWWFFLFTVIARMVTGFIPGVGIAVSLGLLLPSLSATARRLHDTNRTGWWLLLPVGMWLAGIIAGVLLGGITGTGLGGFLGIIAGFLSVLYFLIQPGTPGPNRYGPSPLPPPGMRDHGYTNPGQPHAPPPYNVAPPDYLPQPSGRQYCPQCGAARAAADAQFCTVCGAAF